MNQDNKYFEVNGALWLPDMQRWAQVIANTLKPGGRLIFVEFHPVVWMFDNTFTKIQHAYFNTGPIIETLKGIEGKLPLMYALRAVK